MLAMAEIDLRGMVHHVAHVVQAESHDWVIKEFEPTMFIAVLNR